MFNDKLPYQKRGNLTENDTSIVNDPSTTPRDCPVDQLVNNPLDQHILYKAYQVLQQCQRPPPKGRYPFPRNDHVTTKMGKLLPLPCKACGSPNHWDKECPDYDTNLERAR